MTSLPIAACRPAGGLGDTLENYRRSRGLTVRQAGALVGASHWVWAQWESGVVPSPAYLRHIAALLGVDPVEARRLAGPDRVRRPASTGDAGSTAIAQARFEAGLTASELARRVHVSLASVSRWESGERSPGRQYWPLLAAALGTDVDTVAGCFADRPAPSDVASVRALGAIRRRRGVTQRQLAQRVGVDVSTVQRWEHQGRAPRRQALAVAQLFATALEDLGRPVLVVAGPPVRISALRRLRRCRHLPVRVVASRVGVSPAALRAWERGTNQPSWTHARALARALGTTPQQVFDAAGMRPPAYLDPCRWTLADLRHILRELRQWRGMTQDELAVAVGVSTATIGAWEAGRQRPRRISLRRLDEALGSAPRLAALSR